MRGFETFSFSHNILRFGLVSNKNSAHGVKRGGVVYHHTPPTLSRKIVLLHLCIKKHLSARIDLEWPSESTAAAAASKCFAKVMQLSPSLKIGPKLCRDLIVRLSIVNSLSFRLAQNLPPGRISPTCFITLPTSTLPRTVALTSPVTRQGKLYSIL